MFERLKKTDLRHGKVFDASRRWPYPLGLTDQQQRKPLCALCAAFRFPCRPHKTRASGRDRRARLYARGAACYLRRLAKAADMIYPKYPPVMHDVHCMRVFFYAALAQLAEHPAHNRVVAGSIPARGMIYSRSSSDGTAVSKTAGCRFEPCRECQLRTL